MGGGSQPTDSLGGQYTSFNYTPPQDTFDYSGLSNAFKQFGSGVAGGADTHNYMTGSTIPSQQFSPGQSLPETLIPTSVGGGGDLVALLQRLLSQGGM